MKRKCPTCGRAFEPSDQTQPFRPFCSGRCRAADLGTWLDGAYRIATPLTDDAELEARWAKAASAPQPIAGGSEPFEGSASDDGAGGHRPSPGSKLPQ